LNHKHALAAYLAGVLVRGATTQAPAASVPANAAGLKAAAAGDVTSVRWYHGGFGLGLGLAGAAVAAPYYYGAPYSYG
jgi:hypothetical protein